MTETTEQLQNQFNQMRMSKTAQALPRLLRQAENHLWTYQEFLTVLLDHEVRRQVEKMIEKHLKLAPFPYEKSLDEFDVQAQKSLNQRQFTQLREMGELVYLLKTEEYVRRSQLQLKRIRAAELLIIDDLMTIVYSNGNVRSEPVIPARQSSPYPEFNYSNFQ